MKPSFQDKLKSLKDKTVSHPKRHVSEKVLNRRKNEAEMREDVAINWLETLLLHHDDGVDIKELCTLFIAHYTHDEQHHVAGASNKKLDMVIVAFLKHFLSPAPIPKALVSAYIRVATKFGQSEEERSQYRSAQYHFKRHRAQLEILMTKLASLKTTVAEKRPEIEQERSNLHRALKSIEAKGSFVARLSQDYRDQVNSAKSKLSKFEAEKGAVLRDLELEIEMVDTDLIMAKQKHKSSIQAYESILEAHTATVQIWLSPFGLSESPIEGVEIPKGSYWRGSSGHGHPDEVPLKTIRLNASIWISVVPITQGIYSTIMGFNPSARCDLQRPVEMISWFDALEFCNTLSKLEGLDPVYHLQNEGSPICKWNLNGYRLPTEAEWEVAARASDNTMFSGSDASKMVAWTLENAHNKTQPVRRRRPNGWGIYDMSGNVWEWCWDCYDSKYYQDSPKDDPKGPRTAETNVLRGGAATLPADRARVSNRYHLPPDTRDATVGFRVVRLWESN